MLKQIKTFLIMLTMSCWSAKSFGDSLAYQVQGVEPPLLTNIQNRLDTAKNSNSEDLSEAEIRLFYQQAPEHIIKAMQPYGYYKPSINATIDNDGDQWKLLFHVDPGPIMRITDLEVNISGPGKDDPGFSQLLDDFPLQQDHPLLIEDYNQAKTQLIRTAQQLGYMEARFVQHEIQINRQNYTARIKLSLDTGVKFTFGPVIFHQDGFSEDFLNRLVPFEQGAVYSPDDIIHLQSNLNQSGYFQQVRIDANPDKAEDKAVPIEVSLLPSKAHSFTLGGGYGTDTGVRGIFGWDLRHLTPTGHRLQTFAQLSQVQSAIQTSYVIPGHNPLTDNYNLSATLFHLNLPESRSNAALLSASAISQKQPWLQVLSLNALVERFTNVGEPRTTSVIVYPQGDWTMSHADNLLFPTAGYHLNFRTLGGAKQFLSDVNFFQIKGHVKGIYSVFDGTRVILRGDLGYIFIDNINTLPTSLQFFAGGSDSIRGFSFNSIGPGRTLMVGSAELQQHLFGKFHIAGFYDVGDVFNQFSTRFNRSIGAGLIYESPIGPARLYLAQARSSPGKPFSIVFSIGPDFI